LPDAVGIFVLVSIHLLRAQEFSTTGFKRHL